MRRRPARARPQIANATEPLRWKGGEMVADAERALDVARAGAAYVERYYTHPENRGPLPAA